MGAQHVFTHSVKCQGGKETIMNTLDSLGHCHLSSRLGGGLQYNFILKIIETNIFPLKYRTTHRVLHRKVIAVVRMFTLWRN